MIFLVFALLQSRIEIGIGGWRTAAPTRTQERRAAVHHNHPSGAVVWSIVKVKMEFDRAPCLILLILSLLRLFSFEPAIKGTTFLLS